MTDLDFDELDRAVNSLIGDNDQPVNAETPMAVDRPSQVVPQDEPQVVETTDDKVEQANTTPVLLEPATDTTLEAEPSVPDISQDVEPALVAQPLPLASRRSSGRFMDVVHPSSDMRSQNRVAPRTTEPDTQSSLEQVKPVVALPAIDSSITEYSTPTIDQDESNAEPDQEPAIASPFLADAVVEKRPLGAFNDTEKPSLTADLLQQELDSADSKTDMESVVEPETVELEVVERSKPYVESDIPEELQGDVLSIETNESKELTEAPSQQISPPDAPVAITQQYVEQPSTSATTTAPIFDTEAYQKPAATGKAHHSGWLTVLWIFLLVVLGAGAGAAIYNYVLPLL